MAAGMVFMWICQRERGADRSPCLPRLPASPLPCKPPTENNPDASCMWQSIPEGVRVKHQRAE